MTATKIGIVGAAGPHGQARYRGSERHAPAPCSPPPRSARGMTPSARTREPSPA